MRPILSYVRTKSCLLLAVAVVVSLSQVGMALIFTGGSDPIEDHGWPKGSVEMANLPTRVSWWAGPPFGTGSMYEFQYNCRNTGEFNEALKAFAAIKAGKVELIVHNGPKAGYSPGSSDKDKKPDWTFTVWNPEDWDRLYNSGRTLFMSDHPNFRKPVAPPRVDVYIGRGPVVWKEVKVPAPITVIDKRPGSISKEFAGKGLIHAKVFDMDTKKPIKRAKVIIAESARSVNPPEPLTGLTNKKGFCRIGRIPLANYFITVVAKGYASRKIGYYGNEAPEFYEFETKLTGTAHISGVVVDTEGKPIKDAKVYVRDTIGPDKLGYSTPDAEEAFTDEEGRFRIDSLPKGAASIRCRVPGMYLTNPIFDTYPLPSEDLRLVMTRTSVVRGKVYTKDWATPEGSIHITIRPVGEQMGKWGGTARMKDDGTFEFNGVPPGVYLVGIGGMIKTEEEKKKATLVSVQGGKIYEVELIKEDRKKK